MPTPKNPTSPGKEFWISDEELSGELPHELELEDFAKLSADNDSEELGEWELEVMDASSLEPQLIEDDQEPEEDPFDTLDVQAPQPLEDAQPLVVLPWKTEALIHGRSIEVLLNPQQHHSIWSHPDADDAHTVEVAVQLGPLTLHLTVEQQREEQEVLILGRDALSNQILVSSESSSDRR